MRCGRMPALATVGGRRFLGRRGRNRTCNHRIRNPVLYPFELRARERLSVRFYNVIAIAGFADSRAHEGHRTASSDSNALTES